MPLEKANSVSRSASLFFIKIIKACNKIKTNHCSSFISFFYCIVVRVLLKPNLRFAFVFKLFGMVVNMNLWCCFNSIVFECEELFGIQF